MNANISNMGQMNIVLKAKKSMCACVCLTGILRLKNANKMPKAGPERESNRK